MKKIVLGLLIFGITSVVYAEDEDTTKQGRFATAKGFIPSVSGLLPEAKLAEHSNQLKTGYIGAGMSAKLLHLNAEWVNPYGIAYGKVGAFVNDDHDIGVQVGFRYPYHLTGVDQNGYYFGVYAGHLESITLDGQSKQRLGAGVDLAYVQMDKQRISIFSVGIGAGEELEGRYGSKREIKPQLQFAYSLSLGVF